MIKTESEGIWDEKWSRSQELQTCIMHFTKVKVTCPFSLRLIITVALGHTN